PHRVVALQAKVSGDGLVWAKRVAGIGYGWELIELHGHRQMRSFAPHVRESCRGMFGHLVLYAEAPLLYVRPHGLGRDRNHIERICSLEIRREVGETADTELAGPAVHLNAQDLRRVAHQRSRIGLAAGAVLVEDAITAAYGCGSLAGGVPGE